MSDFTPGQEPELHESPAQSPKSFGAKIQHLFRYKIRLNPLSRKNKAPDSGAVDSTADPQPAKKEKKPKPPKPPKPKKAKKPAPKKGKQAKEGGSKKLAVIAVIFAILGVSGIAFGSIMLINGNNSVDSLLGRAIRYYDEGDYPSAIAAYQQVLDKDVTIADAYLGMADSLVAQDNLEDALTILGEGLEPTGNSVRIQDRIQELTPQDEEAEEPREEPIVWVDSALENMVRQAMELPPGKVVYPSDLDEVTSLKIMGSSHASYNKNFTSMNAVDGYQIGDSFYDTPGDITRLDDLTHFRNLRRLIIGYNRVSDVNGVASLKELETLGLYNNNISDLSPLSDAGSLRYLYLYNNNISDLSPLSSLSALQYLSLENNQVSNLAPLANLGELKELYLENNQVSDIGPLAGMKNLRYIFAQNNQIASIAAVAEIPSLTDVNFTGNPVTDYTPAVAVRNVDRPTPSISIPREG